MAPPDDGDNDNDSPLAREIEEADIIKLQDGVLYVANPFTGLRLVDLADVDEPALMGSAPLGGRAVELFVRDQQAYVLTAADFFRCAGEPVGFDNGAYLDQVAPDFDGSRLWVVDVADPAAPQVANQLDFDGFATATRRVGDVIYVAGNTGDGSGVFVSSINIADPLDVFLVETEIFAGTSLDIHVTAEALYVVGPDAILEETTIVTFVDISDPAGDVVPRDQFRVPGVIENRFFVDEWDGTFRIITEEFFQEIRTRVVALYVYDVSDPDDITRLARMPIVTDESLRAVRFDGERGYAVTFRRVDPLFVIDLADAANPQISGELEVPGYSTFLYPLGDRLIGVGFDTRAGFRPALALYDVSDPTGPRQLSRVVVGRPFTHDTRSEATVDEKAVRIIEEAGLILLPFSSFDDENGVYVDSLQFITWTGDRLRERGAIDHRGLIRRADLLDERAWVLSDLSFQVVDVDDVEEPASVAMVEFITEQALLDAGLAQCADSARHRGSSGFFFGSFCGIIGLIPMLVMVAGLGLLKVNARMRWQRRTRQSPSQSASAPAGPRSRS